MAKLKNGSWVLIADGNKALFLQNEIDTQDYDLQVVWKREMDNPPTRAQGTDRPGRSFASAGKGRSALQETDWHQLAEDRFAKEVAEKLNRASQDGAFEEVVIVAPPAVLGELRQELDSATAAKVIAEIPKTLTNHPIDDIEKLLKTELDAA